MHVGQPLLSLLKPPAQVVPPQSTAAHCPLLEPEHAQVLQPRESFLKPLGQYSAHITSGQLEEVTPPTDRPNPTEPEAVAAAPVVTGGTGVLAEPEV